MTRVSSVCRTRVRLAEVIVTSRPRYKVYLKAYASVLEAQRGLEDYFRFYNGLRPHQALGYRTPAEVFLGDQEAVEGDSSARRCSPEKGTQALAGAPGFSLNSALILSK